MDYDALDISRDDPYIAGRRIKVIDVVFAAGSDHAALTFDDWKLSEEQVHQALHYYLHHKDELGDAPIDDEAVRAQLI